MADQQSRNVFISFQGDNIGKDFATSLFKALSDRGLHTKLFFKGDQLTEGINQSRVIIFIFPENFTGKSLDDELPYFLNNSKLKSHDYGPQFVYPIFYNTNPSHVKIIADQYDATKPNDVYEYQDYVMSVLGAWQAAVHEVADMPGWHFKHGDGNENEFIDKIVEDISRTFDDDFILHTTILDSQNPNSVPNAFLTAVDKVLMAISRNSIHVHDQVSLVFQATKTWRVAGLISGFAGLLCYALSPSFNPLIRGWKPFSIIVYVVLCLVILYIILFAKQASPSTRQSRNHLLSEFKKACTTCAVLIIISMYSLVYDKAVNGKPHILSVISNVAFAMVSLSLRKLTNSGFEIGVFSYFLSCFTIQLLTINWVLIFVAIIFGFMLFLMRSSLNSQSEVEEKEEEEVEVELLGEHNA